MKNASLKAVFLVGIAVLTLVQPGQAANNRSWVSHNGSDGNSCVVSAPCKTFQHAVDQTNPGGEVDVLDAGDYGLVNINKPLTLDGGNRGYIQTYSGLTAVIVNPQRNGTVVVRNLSIHGAPDADSAIAGVGFYWQSGETLYIENVDMTLVAEGFSMAKDLVFPRLYVKNTSVHGLNTVAGSGDGFDIGGNKGENSKVIAVLDHVTVETEYAGIAVNYAKVNVTNSVIAGCGTGAFTGAGAELNVLDSELAFNNVALSSGVSASNGVIRVGGDNIHDNFDAMIGLGQVISYGNNRIGGNTVGASEFPNSTVALR